jgi:hypothetical protein
LQFAEDANDTLWTSGGGPVVGWLNSKMFLETGDAGRSQGWTALVVDTNGNGKRDDYVEPGQPADPAKDTRINSAFYAVMPNPADGSIWGSTLGYPGAVVRVNPGSNPPATALTEVFTPPMPGYGIRGADIDRNGVVWMSMGSGHLGAFDRRKCKGPLNGPAATGNHCPEGWSFYRYPGPGFVGRPDESVESSYYSWVDQHNTSGLGANVPMSTANLFDGVHALVNNEMVTLRIPYPLGFYSKGFEAASTTRTRAGRVVVCGCRAATARRGSRKAAKVRSRWSCTSRFGRIRSRSSGRAPAQSWPIGAQGQHGQVHAPDDPRRPQDVGKKVRAACDLHAPEQRAQSERDGPRLPGSAARDRIEREPNGEPGVAGERMSRWKAAGDLGRCRVRTQQRVIGGRAAEDREAPRTTV